MLYEHSLNIRNKHKVLHTTTFFLNLFLFFNLFNIIALIFTNIRVLITTFSNNEHYRIYSKNTFWLVVIIVIG